MKCPACKSEDHFVLETRVVSDTVTRRRNECSAAHRWSTYERVDLSTLNATRSGKQPLPVAPSTTTCSARPKETEDTTRSVQPLPVALASRSTGGKGGSVSAPISPSDPSPGLSGNPIRARERSETRAFVAFYEAYPRKKARPDAFKAWISEGCEAIAAEVTAGLLRHTPELRGREPDKVPYPAHWLRGREWADPVLPLRAADLRCHFHRSPGTLGKRPPAGWFASCPECKHARAGGGTRTGEPASIADLAAATEKRLAAARAVVPATREQLEDLKRGIQ